ncbi:hypothetical protein [Pseudonocardia spinosispora]|uniref:hypothetical protein n=1 Tax=Pseudonocardia spinosispora TaxID=103441 RepID=UPI000688AA0E|nr:hypothetical protein [Pseudonocardia spinosispora]
MAVIETPGSTRPDTDPRLRAGIGFVVVFLAGLAPTFGTYPTPTSTPAQVLAYFSGHHVVTSINELSQAVAAVGLVVFTAGLAATFGGRAAPQLVAAGTLAASALFVGAALFNVLSLPELADQPALAAAIYHLGFMIGGPGHVVALAVLIGTTAIAGRRSGRLPGWLTVAGFVIAALGLLSALNFATPMLPSALVVPFIPAGRFPGYLFLAATAVVLRRERT